MGWETFKGFGGLVLSSCILMWGSFIVYQTDTRDTDICREKVHVDSNSRPIYNDTQYESSELASLVAGAVIIVFGAIMFTGFALRYYFND